MTQLTISSIETLYYDRIYALHGLSLQVREKEIFAVLGPNGAGKTTLLKTISGLLKDQPKKGTIEFSGKRIERLAPERISRLGIVFVPEDRGLFHELTVQENLDLGCWGRKDHQIQTDYEFIYQLFPILKERTQQMVETLSGGEQQMLALARAMLRRPKLLLLDEPSLGLAPMIARQVYDALSQICRAGTTILMVEQNAKLALSIAHYSYIMESGRIVLEGTAQKLHDHKDVQLFYLGMEQETAPAKGWRLYKKRRTW
ncbi:ABC transporter ATP-binding protein [candidate division CSSED10-310 bacterium]|uniref:ABC transporter ATP-binding protein n=1 Tax=candidate division CSSED10-310 bacterium TaxID=2855610 RepID=A0ABV6YSR5_UNCC1